MAQFDDVVITLHPSIHLPHPPIPPSATERIERRESEEKVGKYREMVGFLWKKKTRQPTLRSFSPLATYRPSSRRHQQQRKSPLLPPPPPMQEKKTEPFCDHPLSPLIPEDEERLIEKLILFPPQPDFHWVITADGTIFLHHHRHPQSSQIHQPIRIVHRRREMTHTLYHLPTATKEGMSSSSSSSFPLIPHREENSTELESYRMEIGDLPQFYVLRQLGSLTLATIQNDDNDDDDDDPPFIILTLPHHHASGRKKWLRRDEITFRLGGRWKLQVTHDLGMEKHDRDFECPFFILRLEMDDRAQLDAPEFLSIPEGILRLGGHSSCYGLRFMQSLDFRVLDAARLRSWISPACRLHRIYPDIFRGESHHPPGKLSLERIA